MDTNMKNLLQKLIFTVLVALCAAEVMAQVPQGFNFQAVARNAAGELIANSTLGVRVSVIQGSETGTVVYTETQTPQTTAIGSFQIVIGEGSSEDDFEAIAWAADNYYVKLEIDAAGGTEYEELGTTRLLSVPYALVAKNVINGGAGSGEAITEYNLNTAGPDSSFIINIDGDKAAKPFQVFSNSTAYNSAVRGEAISDASNTSSQRGVIGIVNGGGTGSHIGVFGNAVNFEAIGASRMGMHGQAASKSKYNYGVQGVAEGEGNGDEGENYDEGSINFGLYGSAAGNSWSNTGLEAYTTGAAGKVNYGVSGLSSAGSEDSTKNYGVAGRAYGTGKNYGVYGAAWDGVENYAGYFDGDVNVNGLLTVNGNPIAGSESAIIDTLNNIKRLQLNNSEDNKSAVLGTTSQGLGNLLFYNSNQQNTAWFGNNDKGGLMQLVGYEDDQSYTGSTLIGLASWENNLPYFYMEGSSENPYVQLVSFGARLNASGNEVPYFNLQTTNRGIDGKGAAFTVTVVNDPNGNDPTGEAAEMFLWGGETPNIQMGGQPWNNGDLGFLAMTGSTGNGDGGYHANIVQSVDSDGTDEWGSLRVYKTNLSGQSSQEMINLNGQNGQIHSKGIVVTGDPFNDRYNSIIDGSISGGQASYTDGFVLNHDFYNGSLLQMYDGGTKKIDINGDSGTITAISVNQTSDVRLKKDIHTLNNALENTLKMRGVSYHWKTDLNNENPQVGVIAQEVEEIYPEFVHTDDDGMKSVNYAQMTAVLIEAVKELNTKLNSLEKENNVLSAKLDKKSELEQRLAQIEDLLGVPASANVKAVKGAE